MNKETKILLNELNIKDKNYIINLDNYISYIKKNTKIKDYILVYIISLTLNNKYNKILDSNKIYKNNKRKYNYYFRKMFMYNYNLNIEYLKRIMKIDKRTFKDFTNHLNNKKRIYPYFELINNDNIFFYLPIIIDLENSIP